MNNRRAVPRTGKNGSSLAELRHQVRQLQENIDRLSNTIAQFTADQLGQARPVSKADVQQILETRRVRETCFGGEIFADPAWDILLHLYAAKLEGHPLSVSFLCEHSGVASSTAIRWIERLGNKGWLVRKKDISDRRRVWVELSDRGSSTMQVFFDAMRVPTAGI